LPATVSRSRNFLSSRNSLLVTSCLRWANQLSSRVSISSLSRVRCSGVSEATHSALLNLDRAGAEAEVEAKAEEAWTPDFAEPEPEPEPAAGFGAPKKDVMVPFCLGFLASPPAPCEPAFRLLLEDILCTAPDRADVKVEARCGGQLGRAKKVRRVWRHKAQQVAVPRWEDRMSRLKPSMVVREQ